MTQRPIRKKRLRQTSRPLVIIARAPDKARGLTRILKRAGADVIAAPVIRTAPPISWRSLDDALKRLANFDAAAFASANAVNAFFTRAQRQGLKKLKAPKLILAVGPATARVLSHYHWKAHMIPDNPSGKNLARLIQNARGLHVLVPRAKEGKDDLIRELRKKGAIVRAVEAYRTLPDRRRAKTFQRLALDRRLMSVVFFSGSSVRAFCSQIKPRAWNRLRPKCLFAALGPTAFQALRELGARKILQARRANSDDLARLLRQALLSTPQ